MKGALFLLALTAVPVMGWPAARRLTPNLTLPATLGVAGALGAILLCAAMFLLTGLGNRWSVPLLLTLAVTPALLVRRRRRDPGRVLDSGETAAVFAGGATVFGLAAVTFAVATARASAPDLLLFWGTKAQRFAQVRAIDTAFLQDPLHIWLHPDYPPLLVSLFAWAALVAGRFAWGAAMLSLPLFLGLALATFYGFARPAVGRRSAAEHTALMTPLLGLVMVATLMAGNADPLLLYFEVLTLSALVFAGNQSDGLVAAAAGLTGAILTKVEGTAFVVLVVAAFVVLGSGTRRLRSAILLGLPPFLALAGWIAFCRAHGLLDIYRPKERTVVTAEHLPAILRLLVVEAGYGVVFAPWIVVLVLLVWRRTWRATAVPLFCAAGFTTFIVYMYMTSPADPTVWIRWSAGRLLLTLLACLAVASAAPSRRPA